MDESFFAAMGNGVSQFSDAEMNGLSGYEACPTQPESPPLFQSGRPSVPRRQSSHPYKSVKKIACLGSGFVGGPTSAVIAFKTGLEVTVVDVDKERIDAWNSDTLPIFEPHLKEIVKVARGNRLNLFFSTDVEAAIAGADLIFVCVNTPTKRAGIGKGAASDTGYVEVATRAIARVATQHKIIVEKSTVPCKTAESMRKIVSTARFFPSLCVIADRSSNQLEANAKSGVHFDVLSNPEFLAEGTAIRDLLWPDRVIIGSTSTSSGRKAAGALVDLYAQWIPRDRIVTMNSWSSELSKLAANAMLAQRVSSANALSAICEATGADVEEVTRAVGLDSRIGSQMLKAGPGFGGSCFQKDLYNIVYLAQSLHLYEVADYWRSIIKMNEYQKLRFTKRILACLFNSLTNKKIAVLGFAFKKNTSDTRDSPAIAVVKSLIAEGARVAIYDPCVTENQIWSELLADGIDVDLVTRNAEIFKNVYDACDEADAVVVVTEWDEFSNRKSHSQLARLTMADVAIRQMVNAESHTGPSETETPPEKSSTDETPAAEAATIPPNPPNTINTLGVTTVPPAPSKSTDTSGITALPPSPPKSVYISEIDNPKAGKQLDWARIGKRMKKPRFVFDGRNILDVDALRDMGFVVESIGKASSDFHLRRDL